MTMRRRIFLLSVLFHLICIYWIARVKMPMFIIPETEQVIAVVPISSPPLAVTSPISQKVRAGKKLPGKETGLPGKSRSGRGSASTTRADTTIESIDSEIPVEPPKLMAPPLDVKEISELSIYSENIRDIIKNFGPGRKKTRRGRTASGLGESGTGDGSGPARESQAFFNIENYDLTPWAKRVLFRIQKNWLIPMVFKESIQQPAEITTVIEKDGKISSIKVKQSSNSDAFDQAAVNALRLSAPLPSLPEDFPNKNLEARFLFTSNHQ